MTEEPQDAQAPQTPDEPQVSRPEQQTAKPIEQQDAPHADNGDSLAVPDDVNELEEAWDQVDEEIETYSATIDELLARRRALHAFAAKVAGDLAESLDDKIEKINKIFADEIKGTDDSERMAKQAMAGAQKAAGAHSLAQERVAELSASYAELQTYTTDADAALDALDTMRQATENESDPTKKYSKLKYLNIALQAVDLLSADAHIAALEDARGKLQNAEQAAGDAAAILEELEAAANAAAEVHDDLTATRAGRIAEKIDELAQVTPAAA